MSREEKSLVLIVTKQNGQNVTISYKCVKKETRFEKFDSWLMGNVGIFF
jgi:hypothetical protein